MSLFGGKPLADDILVRVWLMKSFLVTRKVKYSFVKLSMERPYYKGYLHVIIDRETIKAVPSQSLDESKPIVMSKCGICSCDSEDVKLSNILVLLVLI